ncbi:MAG: DUF11 domain-containing protein [Gammaproteobacteria bacterium]|nr:DUF11 domain-containing protein [Gammaproteobacteria bacterium]
MPKNIKFSNGCLSGVRFGGGIALAFLLVAGGLGNMAQAAATTLLGPVDLNVDEADALPGDGVCKATGGNYCTLRAAIQESNALFAKGVTDITITVNAGTYALGLTGVDDDAAVTGDLDILGTCPSADINVPCLKIEGKGKGQTIINGNGLARVFHFVGKNTVKITGVTIQNGGVTNENGGGIKNSNSWVTLENCEVINNTVESTTGARYGGGGIYNAIGARMVINSCTISGNKVNNAQGIKADDYIFGVGGGGGGISNVGVMTINKTIIQANSGRPLGGGILNVSGFVGDSGKLTIANSSLLDNKNVKDDGISANGVGGALSNQGGLVSIKQSIVRGNAAREGGGVFNTNSAAGQGTISGSVSIIASVVDSNTGNGLSNKDAMEVRYSTISNNTAQPFEPCAGGSGGCTNGADGGGINNYGPGELTVENSTLTGNTARNGGGINNVRAMTLTSITTSGNTATAPGGGNEIFINVQDVVSIPTKLKTVLLSNIIGGNASSSNNCSGGTVNDSGSTIIDTAYLSTITSKGRNLENGNSCGLNGAGDLNANPNLDVLANNGGSAGTTVLPDGTYPNNFLPLPGSPAIGNGACPSPPFDQRQFGRPGLNKLSCDIGAVETGGIGTAKKVDLEVQNSANVPTVVLNGSVIYTLTVTNHGPDIAEGIILTDKLPAGVSYAGWAQPVPSTNPAGVVCAAPTPSADFTCTLASLAPDASFTVYLTAQVTDPSLVPTDPNQLKTIENMAAVTVASPSDYLPGNNGSVTSCVRGACAITRVLAGDGVTNFTPSGGGGVFSPWALLLLGVPGLFLLRRRA